MTETVEKAKPGPKPKNPAAGLKLAVALHRIDGHVMPGTVVLATPATYAELIALEAIREPDEGEVALFEKSPASAVKIGPDAGDDIEAALG